jgi:formate dehydrogenase beta subunit
MTKVIFSSWDGEVVDNRGQETANFKDARNLPLSLQYDGHQVNAFMSWGGLVVADKKANIVDITRRYLQEAQKLSCGECSVGYLGVKVMTDILNEIAKGQGTKESIASLKRLGNGIKENGKCDYCPSAVTPVLDAINYYEDEFLKPSTRKGASSRASYLTRITAPCSEACPAHQDVPGYMKAIENGRYAEALELIRETNCFPGSVGRACVAFCESNCCRSNVDSPLAIRAMKRFPADYEMSHGLMPTMEKKRRLTRKVAVIGAGPAGMSAAYNLALMGYKVTVYDEQSSPGGMAMVGIPAYRLPDDILNREVDIIKDLGVEVKLNTRVGKDVTLKQLSDEGFKAIFLGIGAHLDQDLDIKNWEKGSPGMVNGVEFLSDVNQSKKTDRKDRVVVVGGGNVAIDCARTCLRLGSKNVTIVYRRSRAEMPATKEEVDEAEKEGAKILFLATPVGVVTANGRVTGAECIKMELGEPDASGRRRPIPVKGSEVVVDTDMIISAIGEKPDLSFLSGKSVDLNKDGTIAASAPDYQTSVPYIFAGGDCVTGPATLIEAIAAGNRAAKSIDQYLQTGKVTPAEEVLAETLLHNVALNSARKGSMAIKKQRQAPQHLPVPERKLNFNEMEKVFTRNEAIQEAKRCLRCYRVMLMAVTAKK